MENKVLAGVGHRIRIRIRVGFPSKRHTALRSLLSRPWENRIREALEGKEDGGETEGEIPEGIEETVEDKYEGGNGGKRVPWDR